MRMFGQDTRSGLSVYVVGMPLIAIVGLSILLPLFPTEANFSNVSSQIATLSIVSIGQLIVALVAGIDLSVGSVISLTTCIIANSGGSWWGVAAALAAGAAVGAANGLSVTVVGLHPIIATLAMMMFVQGVALYLLPAPGGSLPEMLGPLINGATWRMPNTLILVIAGVLLMSWLLQHTRFGLRLYAVGANPRSAYSNGIPDKGLTTAAYTISGVAAVVAGIVIGGRIGSGDPQIGVPFALNSVTAVALGGAQFAGGVGSVFGVFCGVLTLGLMRNGMNLGDVDAFLQSSATGMLLLIAISFQKRSVVGF
jgi:ribose transport system permease protein